MREDITENGKPVRVAQVIGKLGKGGVEAVINNYYRAIDHEKIQFDYFIDADSLLSLPQDILSSGARRFVIPPCQRLPQYVAALTRLFRQNRYRIVHVNMNTLSVFALCAAWLAGVPVRINHNHSAAHRNEGCRFRLKLLLRPFAKLFATDLFACGVHAGEWLFGRDAVRNGNVTVIKNAIPTRKFAYRPDIRRDTRQRLGLEGCFVIGHVGRFTPQKNHAFLLDIFQRVYARRPDARLLLIGDGPLKEEISAKAQALGIDEAVIFAGFTDSPEKAYQAMDAFCFPSLFEGFGLAAAEAQTSGLPVIASTEVPAEVEIAPGMVRFLSLADTPERWAEEIILCDGMPRRDMSRAVREAGYDIEQESKKLERRYLELYDSAKGH